MQKVVEGAKSGVDACQRPPIARVWHSSPIHCNGKNAPLEQTQRLSLLNVSWNRKIRNLRLLNDYLTFGLDLMMIIKTQ